MYKVHILIAVVLAASVNWTCTTSSNGNEAGSGSRVNLVRVADNLSAPVALEYAPGETGNLYVAEQTGTIRIIRNGKLLAEPFLDIRDKLDNISIIYSEKGLLGLAFHPGYKTNGRFYVHYSGPALTRGADNTAVIAEYTVSKNNPLKAAKEERILMRIDQPQSNHNGGQLAFGPDGFLYIGLGDGGGAGDQHGTSGNGQNKNTLLGKILRIDVDKPVGYGIPQDNPFVQGGGLPEIYATGLRNPWRFSFDYATSRLFCPDVGQNKWEEVNIITKGKNYGWRIMEGRHCYDPPQGCNTQGLTFPIDEYGRSTGICVIGGFVYRGNRNSAMFGKYVFGDWNGNMFVLAEDPTGQWKRSELLTGSDKGVQPSFNINSFGRDEKGEIYVVTQKRMGPRSKTGVIYRMDFKQ